MTRRFYFFGSLEAIKGHIAEVKTLSDLAQLRYDIEVSQTTHARFKQGVPGVYAVDSVLGENGNPFRHIFMTKGAHKHFGDVREFEADSWSVLEE